MTIQPRWRMMQHLPPRKKTGRRTTRGASGSSDMIPTGTSKRHRCQGLAPVAFVDLTVPGATEGGKSAKEDKAIEDKGKGKAEEGQDTYGEGGSSGRGGGRGEGKCRHGKQRCKCRECRGEGEAADGEGRGQEEPETQGREKRARTTQPRIKCPHDRRKSQCVDCGGSSICSEQKDECIVRLNDLEGAYWMGTEIGELGGYGLGGYGACRRRLAAVIRCSACMRTRRTTRCAQVCQTESV